VKQPHELTLEEYRELYQRSAGRKGFDAHQQRTEDAAAYWNEPSRRETRTSVVTAYWNRYQRMPSEKELHWSCYIQEAIQAGIELTESVQQDYSKRLG